MTYSPDSPEDHVHGRKRRVGKACDSCRIKKTKCDGTKPCLKCTSDNKICVYTERRKLASKSYPAGYVELLETRIDLLSRSLEKVLDLALSGKNLHYLATHREELEVPESSGDRLPGYDSKFSINSIILRLIKDEGLLDNQPVEWDQGASIAANISNDRDSLMHASSEFAHHGRSLVDEESNPVEPLGLHKSLSMATMPQELLEVKEDVRSREAPLMGEATLEGLEMPEETFGMPQPKGTVINGFPLYTDLLPTEELSSTRVLSDGSLSFFNLSELSLDEDPLGMGLNGFSNGLELFDKNGIDPTCDSPFAMDLNFNPFRSALASFNHESSLFSHPPNSATSSISYASAPDTQLYGPVVFERPRSDASLSSLLEMLNLNGVASHKVSGKGSRTRRASSTSSKTGVSRNGSHRRSSSMHESLSLSPITLGGVNKPSHHRA